jgi:hypothetical protein
MNRTGRVNVIEFWSRLRVRGERVSMGLEAYKKSACQYRSWSADRGAAASVCVRRLLMRSATYTTGRELT